MNRIAFLLFGVFAVQINAQSIVAFLKSIENNHTLHMSYQGKAFVCRPYGVDTISDLAFRTDTNSSCRGYIDDFRRVDPKERFFAAFSLHVEQQYSVEGIEDTCLLHLSSGHSYSEALLEKGYARISAFQSVEDALLNYRFKKAVKRAKNTKAGMWSDVNIRNCFLTGEKD